MAKNDPKKGWMDLHTTHISDTKQKILKKLTFFKKLQKICGLSLLRLTSSNTSGCLNFKWFLRFVETLLISVVPQYLQLDPSTVFLLLGWETWIFSKCSWTEERKSLPQFWKPFDSDSSMITSSLFLAILKSVDLPLDFSKPEFSKSNPSMKVCDYQYQLYTNLLLTASYDSGCFFIRWHLRLVEILFENLALQYLHIDPLTGFLVTGWNILTLWKCSWIAEFLTRLEGVCFAIGSTIFSSVSSLILHFSKTLV